MPRVRFVPANEKPPIHHKHGGGTKVGRKKKVVVLWSFRPVKSLRFSPVRFFRGIGAKVVRALQFVSTRKRYSRKISLSSLAGSCSYAENLDSQRAEAIKDCIEFLKSSSSLQRSVASSF
ncbi:Hypothetical predicted protein [Olea europaea subsp. europaea]|uniref:Josephin-like protein n=1 Tax=Olea europaea subsp. europaea TaxID=158383 RepID=A0A8S0VKF6_OLEEU|nr:Hypothetical predicted protein [Olea europaea subsp. europaea]